MTDYLETYLNEPAPQVPDNYAALQKIALREFDRLTKEIAGPAQAQVESYYTIAQKAIDNEMADARHEIEQTGEQNITAARQQYEATVAGIRRHYENQLDDLQKHKDRDTSDVSSNFDAADQEGRQKCEYDILTAETVADGTRKKLKQQRQQFAASIPARRRRLDQRYETALALIRHYRQPAPETTETPAPEVTPLPNPEAVLKKQEQRLDELSEDLANSGIARLFAGLIPFLLLFTISGAAAGIAFLLTRLDVITQIPPLTAGIAAFVSTLAITAGIGRLLWIKARTRTTDIHQAMTESLAAAKIALEQYNEMGLAHFQQQLEKVTETKAADINKARAHFEKLNHYLVSQRDDELQKINDQFQQTCNRIKSEYDTELQNAQTGHEETLNRIETKCEQAHQELIQKTSRKTRDLQDRYESARARLHERWQQSLNILKQFQDANAAQPPDVFCNWQDPAWKHWEPPYENHPQYRFGRIELDWSALDDEARQLADFPQNTPLTVPAILSFTDRGSLLLETRRQGREQAIYLLRAVILRLFTTIPPGRVQFTILDPVSLGENFAGFMHAADYVEALVGGRIWTDAAQIQQQLTDLTHHMENVIQKYLRNEFSTIEEYNRRAGELAEPYRYLVIADFPHHFNEDAVRQLSSIINSGPRCGVYTLIAYDARQDMPPELDLDDLAARSVHLKYEENRFVWQDEVYRRFELLQDAPPDEERLTAIMHKVGNAAKDTTRVEVPFATIAPNDDEIWSLSSAKDINIPIGRTGANRLQRLVMGHGVAQHGLLAGKTGSGKSTLLHVIITNLALWYSPEEVELYLIDFKKGVEFKTYVTHRLPHARTIAIESDREFGLSILQRLDAIMTQRGNLFRQAGVQDIAAYRQTTGKKLPRILLLVDEFQIFFTEDDKLSQDAAIYMEQLVRQGRAFGIHVILGSQTLGGSSNLARSTIGQMAIRIALQCSEIDSQIILDDDNTAARLLNRPGEAIYNDAGGMVVGNSPFQISWLSEAQRDGCLARANELLRQQNLEITPPIVFEGNIPADITQNHQLQKLRANPPQKPPQSATAWLGEPVAIKEPTGVKFQSLSGANLMIIGQRDEAALGILAAALVSLAAHHPPQSTRFLILDGSAPDAPTAGKLLELALTLPNNCTMVDWRDAEETISAIHQDMQQRTNAHTGNDAPTTYLLIFGIQRYRMLRRSEDDFGLASLSEENTPKTDKLFAEILRDGPAVGIHTLLWSDTLASLERTFERSTLREFDNRVLFQMSATDSSTLIDSPMANRLGFHRALFFSEEQGLLEKFRPYAFPPLDNF